MSETDPILQDSSQVMDITPPSNTEDSGFTGKTTIARWYAIQVASSCEKKVKATLEQLSLIHI